MLWKKGSDPVQINDASTFSVAFTPDSTFLVSGHGGKVKVWEVSTTRLHREFNHGKTVWALAVSEDGKYLAAGGREGTVKIWDLSTASQIKAWNAHSDWIDALSYSTCGKYLLSCCSNTIKVWETRSYDQHRLFDEGASTVKFIPNSKQFVSGHWSVKIWSVDDAQPLRTFNGHNSSVISIDVTRCGRYIVAGDYETNNVELYNQNGHIHSYQAHSQSYNFAAFSPCGKFIVSGGVNDKTICTWVNCAKLEEECGVATSSQYDGTTIQGV